MPNIVRRNTNPVPISVTAVTPMVTRSITSMRTPPMVNELNTQSGFGNARCFGETKICHSAWDSRSIANEVSSIVNGSAVRTQRNATFSVTTDAIDGAGDDDDRHPPPAAAVEEEEVRRVGADRDQLAVGEVDQVHHAEDQRDAEREQRVGAADAEPVDESSG